MITTSAKSQHNPRGTSVLLVILTLLGYTPEKEKPSEFPGKHLTKSTSSEKNVDSITLKKFLNVLTKYSGENDNDDLLDIINGQTIRQGRSVEKKHSNYSCSKSTFLTIRNSDGLKRLLLV